MANKRFTVYLRSPEGVYADGSGFVADDDSGIQLNQDTANPIVFGGGPSSYHMATQSLGGHSVFIPMGNVAMYVYYGKEVR